jgi:hypothetical protein
MEPVSFSATALNVYELCPARYKAEHLDRAKGFGGTAATLGSTVHGALELFVQTCYIDKTETPTFDLLIDYLKISYTMTFGSSNYETIEYMEGYEMLKRWFARTSFEGVSVISCEKKDFFDVPTSIGPKPFNYIWDRFDQIGPKTFKVVDYKSNRWNITHDDLKKKIQARGYSLAAAIQLKKQGIEYDRIWVEFDMLRHSPIGISFSWEDNKVTWEYILRTAEEIIATNDDEVMEKLNNECRFCVRKLECNALKKNILVGGIHSLGGIEEVIDTRAQLDWQSKGLASLIADLDAKILAEAKERDMHEFESDDVLLKIGVSSTRAVDAERVQHVIGDKLFEQFGDTKITMASIDKLLKGNDLTSEQKAGLRALIYQKAGEPRVKVETKNAIDP